MRKLKKVFLAVFMLLALVAISVPTVYAARESGYEGDMGGGDTTKPTNPYGVNTDSTPSLPGTGTVDNKIKNKTKDIWATVVVLVQIASVACVVFAGLRYMFASADQKADIKKGLIYLSIGAIIVFGATTIIKFVVDAAEGIIQ